MVEKLTKESFKDKIFDFEGNTEWNYKGTVPAVIDFYADWCGPCKMVAPVMDELATEYNGKVEFFKIDTDAEQELAMMFGIQSIPSILFIPAVATEKPQMSVGAMAKANMKKAIEEVLKVAQN